MKNKEIKKIIIFCKLGLEDSSELKSIKNYLDNKNISHITYVNDRKNEIEFDLENVGLLISLGGDGNIISACRYLANSNIPVFGVNAGNLGFLTEFKTTEFETGMNEFLSGSYKLERPFLLSVQIKLNNGKILQKYAFNDAVFNRANHLLLADIKTSFKGDIFNNYNADGLIISTPSGSTAYNLSAGGSIIYPLSRVFMLTPICSHSLTQRPIVLPKSFFIDIISANCTLSIDGQEVFNKDEFKSVRIGLSNVRANIIRRKNSSYFRVLNEKLNWGEVR
ncbi:NAD(+)/NADH kinase [Campylobacter sp. RM9333]|uniref:NAD(+)/NADH kinase n=1 Tax=Campylobacter sp. RM9333 TaxID=2735731 RepID=UPI001DFE4EA8|nr:NAD(+)/NADH kinase [Campylobacter sp. RM9333]